MKTTGLAGALCALAAALGIGSAHAQILIGQTVGITGSAAATVAESMQGAALYIDHVNAKGGIGGQKVEVISLDDKFDPKLTLQNTKTLIEEKGVIGLFMTRGTPHTQGIMPLLEQNGVPLVGPSTGATSTTPCLSSSGRMASVWGVPRLRNRAKTFLSSISVRAFSAASLGSNLSSRASARFSGR